MWRHVAALTSPLTLPTIYRAGSESGNTRLRLLALAFTVQHVTVLHGFLVTLPRRDVELVLGHDWLEVGGLHLRGVYFSFCGEDHPRSYFLFLAGFYFLSRIVFSAAGLVNFLRMVVVRK